MSSQLSSLTSISSAADHASLPAPSSSFHASLPAPAAMPAAAVPSYDYSAATAQLLARISSQPAPAGWDQAREHVLNTIVTSDNLPPLPPPRNTGRGRGRPRGSGKRKVLAVASTAAAAAAAAAAAVSAASAVAAAAAAADDTPLPDGLAGAAPLSLSLSQMTPLPQRGRGRGRPRGSTRRKKRRRGDSDDEDDNDDGGRADGYASSDGAYVSDGSDAHVVPLKTKSGRRVHRPAQFVPIMASPTTRQGKRRRMRRNPDSAVCKSCDRGHSPNNNVIVFCDSCGTPYHQFCHDPPIARDVVDIPEKEWNCIECTHSTGDMSTNGIPGLIPGQNMNMEEKRKVLQSVPIEKVIDILLHLSARYPNLAIFPKDPSRFSLPSSEFEAAENGAKPNEGHYDGYETDPPQHYPKPGKGLASTLPPESADVQWLLDDNFEVFNHVTYDVPPGPVFSSAINMPPAGLQGTGLNISSSLPRMANGQASAGASLA